MSNSHRANVIVMLLQLTAEITQLNDWKYCMSKSNTYLKNNRQLQKR